MANIVDVSCDFLGGCAARRRLLFLVRPCQLAEGGHEAVWEAIPVFVCCNERLGWNKGLVRHNGCKENDFVF